MASTYDEYVAAGGFEGMDEDRDAREQQAAEIWAEDAWLRAAEAPSAESMACEDYYRRTGIDVR